MSKTTSDILAESFIPALEGLPITEQEKPGTAEVLRNKVVTILLDEMATNLAGNFVEQMQLADEDEENEDPPATLAEGQTPPPPGAV